MPTETTITESGLIDQRGTGLKKSRIEPLCSLMSRMSKSQDLSHAPHWPPLHPHSAILNRASQIAVCGNPASHGICVVARRSNPDADLTWSCTRSQSETFSSLWVLSHSFLSSLPCCQRSLDDAYRCSLLFATVILLPCVLATTSIRYQTARRACSRITVSWKDPEAYA